MTVYPSLLPQSCKTIALTTTKSSLLQQPSRAPLDHEFHARAKDDCALRYRRTAEAAIERNARERRERCYIYIHLRSSRRVVSVRARARALYKLRLRVLAFISIASHTTRVYFARPMSGINGTRGASRRSIGIYVRLSSFALSVLDVMVLTEFLSLFFSFWLSG